jgi:predicted phage terminase large subunit-like protein
MNYLNLSKTQIKQAAEKALCEKSFYHFVRLGWKYVDPAKLVDDWHIPVLCNELESFWHSEILRLIINIPPRCLKSTICSVFFPVWTWIQESSTKLLTGSYAQQLATRDTTKSRNLIQSHWFQSHWGHLFKFSADQNQKTFYKNTKNGERISFSVGGALTGAGGDIIIVDDPINAMDSNSLVKRESVNTWFSESLTTRLNDPSTGRILIIMQRLHQNDLTGYLLSDPNNSYKHIVLPMRYEGKKVYYDIRTKKGEILAKRHTNETLSQLESDLGPYATAGQLQQRPAPREGGVIKVKWLRYYSELPKVKRWDWSWDTAIKDKKNNDFSVGTLWAECEDGYYLVDMIREKLQYPELKHQVRISYDSQKTSEILIEDKSSGQQLVQDFKRIGKMPVIAMIPGKDMLATKEERLEIVSSLFESSKVFLPKGKKWMNIFIEELTNFPNAQHDDIVDSVTQYLSRRLSRKKLVYSM